MRTAMCNGNGAGHECIVDALSASRKSGGVTRQKPRAGHNLQHHKSTANDQHRARHTTVRSQGSLVVQLMVN